MHASKRAETWKMAHNKWEMPSDWAGWKREEIEEQRTDQQVPTGGWRTSNPRTMKDGRGWWRWGEKQEVWLKFCLRRNPIPGHSPSEQQAGATHQHSSRGLPIGEEGQEGPQAQQRGEGQNAVLTGNAGIWARELSASPFVPQSQEVDTCIEPSGRRLVHSLWRKLMAPKKGYEDNNSWDFWRQKWKRNPSLPWITLP